MKIESHLENLRESTREIEEAIRKGLLQKQRTIGFHTSAGAIDMLEIMLHKNNLVDAGFVIKHEWFKSKKKIAEKFHFNFSDKEEIIKLVTNIENMRNKLCYGKRVKEKELENVVQNFNKLKELFLEVTEYEL